MLEDQKQQHKCAENVLDDTAKDVPRVQSQPKSQEIDLEAAGKGKVLKKALPPIPKKSDLSSSKKFGFVNRINMDQKQYQDYVDGKLSKIHVNNAFINSCVPHQFKKQSKKALESEAHLLESHKLLASNPNMVSDYGNSKDNYVNEPQVRRNGSKLGKSKDAQSDNQDKYQDLYEKQVAEFLARNELQENQMKSIIDAQLKKADQLAADKKSKKLHVILEDLEAKRLDAKAGVDSINIQKKHKDCALQTIARQTQEDLDQEIEYKTKTGDSVNVKNYKQTAKYEMKKRKLIEKNGKIDINQLNACNHPLINIAGEKFKRDRQAHDIQDNILKMNIIQHKKKLERKQVKDLEKPTSETQSQAQTDQTQAQSTIGFSDLMSLASRNNMNSDSISFNKSESVGSLMSMASKGTIRSQLTDILKPPKLNQESTSLYGTRNKLPKVSFKSISEAHSRNGSSNGLPPLSTTSAKQGLTHLKSESTCSTAVTGAQSTKTIDNTSTKTQQPIDNEEIVKQIIKKKSKFQQKPVRVYDGNALLVKPQQDCSEKELFVRNGFKNPLGNFKKFLKNGDRIYHDVNMNVQKPEKFGEFTKDNHGQQMRIGSEGQKPKFNKEQAQLPLAKDEGSEVLQKMLKEIRKEEMKNDLCFSNTKVNESIKDDVTTPQASVKKNPKKKKSSNFGNWNNFSRNNSKEKLQQNGGLQLNDGGMSAMLASSNLIHQDSQNFTSMYDQVGTLTCGIDKNLSKGNTQMSRNKPSNEL